ncbi:MAG: hypothetical protein K2X11_11085 [Acetobacteraceae bacterium]|nr:hypothetical protein [Acetobacteraceae bacterium]
MDKSIIARWLSGSVRPADHSLSVLSERLSGRIAGFSRADWDLPLAAFRERLGLAAAVPARPADAVLEGSPLPLALEESAGLLEQSIAVNGGRYVMLYHGVSRLARLYAYAARIVLPPGGAAMILEFTNGVAVHGRGLAFALHGRIYAYMAAVRRRDSLGFLLLNTKVEHRLAILDGLICMRDGGLDAAAAAARCMLIRIGDEVDDPAFAATVERVNRCTDAGWETMLPAETVAAFAAPLPSQRLRVTADESWARTEPELAHAESAPQAALVARMRELLRG